MKRAFKYVKRMLPLCCAVVKFLFLNVEESETCSYTEGTMHKEYFQLDLQVYLL